MRAVAVTRFGGPEVLDVVERPAPIAGAGEVRVAVTAAPVNPVDLGLRSGRQAARLAAAGLEAPFVAGMEAAATVEHLGPGVEGWSVGERVAFAVTPYRSHGGAQAELVVVPAARLVRLPAGLDAVAASLLPMNGLTAALAVERSGVGRGDRLLVTGAAGVVGSLVVQIARRRGVEVVAHGRSGQRARLLELGASVVVEALARDEQSRSAVDVGIDAVVDAAVLGPAVTHVLGARGTYVALRELAPEELAPGWSGTFLRVTDDLHQTSLVETLLRLAASNDLRLPATHRITPAQAADAQEALAAGGIPARPVIVFDRPAQERS